MVTMLKIWIDRPLPFAFEEGSVMPLSPEKWEQFKEENKPIHLDKGWLPVRNDDKYEIIITGVTQCGFIGYKYDKQKHQLFRGKLLPPPSRFWGAEVIRVDSKGNWEEAKKMDAEVRE